MANIHAEDMYERLGVERSAGATEVRQAYHRLLRQYPPERAPEEFKRIREAYEILSDPTSRQEYDARPDPAVQQWIDLAIHAMDAGDYSTAERHLEAALDHAPDIVYARNLLGLCCLYQHKASKAVAQFERLLATSGDSAAIQGNAAHAYQMAGRAADAERCFKRAIMLCDQRGDDPSAYYIGLADFYVEAEEYILAIKVLERAVQSDGRVDFQDLRFFIKLLEIHVLRGDTRVAQRILCKKLLESGLRSAQDASGAASISSGFCIAVMSRYFLSCHFS